MTNVSARRARLVFVAAIVACGGDSTGPTPEDPVLMLDVGYNHSCAITQERKLFCWGLNDNGQLGIGTTAAESLPVAVTGDHEFESVTAGGNHTCAVTSNGKVYCWGENSWGQLGDGSNTDRAAPVPVEGNLRFTEIVAASQHTCGLTSDQQVYCWGFLLNTTSPTPTTPEQVSGTVRFESIGTADLLTCGIDVTGASWCFEEVSGPAGVPDRLLWRPKALPTVLRFTAFTGGLQFMCAVSTGGAAYCWGQNDYGEIGNGSYEPSTEPTLVSGNLTLRSIHSGYDWACGITRSKGVHCWGQNSSGVFGVEGEPPNTFPTPRSMPLPAGLAFNSMDGGFHHMCGVSDVSTAYCWGGGFDGQLGDGKSSASDEFHHRTTPNAVRFR